MHIALRNLFAAAGVVVVMLSGAAVPKEWTGQAVSLLSTILLFTVSYSLFLWANWSAFQNLAGGSRLIARGAVALAILCIWAIPAGLISVYVDLKLLGGHI